MQRRRFIEVVGLGFAGLAGCTAEDEPEVRDSDGDGMIDSKDYAPNDPDVQKKSDITGGSNSNSGNPSGSSSQQPTSTPTQSPTPTATPSIQKRAKEIPYDDLFRNIEQHIGDFVYFGPAQVIQVVEGDSGNFQFRINVTKENGFYDDDVFGHWSGDRFLEEDIVEFWGEVLGILKYETVLGNQRSIPELDIYEMNLIEESSGSVPTPTPMPTPTRTATPTPLPDIEEIRVQIIYGNDWQGSLSVTDSDGSTNTKSIDDIATRSYEIDEDAKYIAANAQKQDDSHDELIVQIVIDGQVVAEESTTSPYGIAQVSYSVD